MSWHRARCCSTQRDMGRSAARRLFVCLVVSGLLVAGETRAQDADPWFGHDKVLHLTVSAGLAAGGYTAGAFAFDARYEALLAGGGLALAAGTAKEVADLAGWGHASWRDFTWDVIGTALGLGLTWGLDLAVRGVDRAHPALGSQPHALVVRF